MRGEHSGRARSSLGAGKCAADPAGVAEPLLFERKGLAHPALGDFRLRRDFETAAAVLLELAHALSLLPSDSRFEARHQVRAAAGKIRERCFVAAPKRYGFAERLTERSIRACSLQKNQIRPSGANERS
jgi:hypothetical protein